eukprot:m.1644657 g.1644657  ORF g.1644657 m.1644657 type:complete len:105 (-) comp63799_c0_seq1:92-406(-)
MIPVVQLVQKECTRATGAAIYSDMKCFLGIANQERGKTRNRWVHTEIHNVTRNMTSNPAGNGRDADTFCTAISQKTRSNQKQLITNQHAKTISTSVLTRLQPTC